MHRKVFAFILARKLASSLIAATVVTIGLAATQPANSVHPAPATPLQVKPSAPTVTHKTITETKLVAFQTQQVNDSVLPSGQTSVQQQGVNGVETLTYDEAFDGSNTTRTLVSDQVTTPATDQIVRIGTYVAPAPQPTLSNNNTYTNSDGNTIHSPAFSSSVPAGATAQCRDGSYSFSQHRSGTCSYHGGVATWL